MIHHILIGLAVIVGLAILGFIALAVMFVSDSDNFR